MTNNTGNNSPQPQKGHINQNLVIAIIGAIATLVAAILPWALDRAAQAEPSPSPVAIQSTFTAAPLEATATNTVVVSSPTSEPPTVTATSTEETGIYNTFLAFDADGNFINTSFKTGETIYVFFDLNDPKDRNIIKVIVSVVDVPGFLKGAVVNQLEDKIINPSVRLTISQSGLKPGKYKVDLYLNNTLDETIEFDVIE